MNKDIKDKNQIIRAIREGGKAQLFALRRLFKNKALRAVVRQVLEEGGGVESDFFPVFKSCIVFFDRSVRLYPENKIHGLEPFFRQSAKYHWGKRLQDNKECREKVLKFVAEDKDLPQRLKASILKGGGKADSSHECYQDGFLILEKQLRQGKYQGGAIMGFFFQICYNSWRNSWRKKKNVSLESVDFTDPVEQSNPQKLLEIKESNTLLTQAFERLKERCRQILVLKYFRRESFSMEEIARQMGLKNAQNASNALSRCRENWKAQIDKFKKDYR